jgi:hypothetical protein
VAKAEQLVEAMDSPSGEVLARLAQLRG